MIVIKSESWQLREKLLRKMIPFLLKELMPYIIYTATLGEKWNTLANQPDNP